MHKPPKARVRESFERAAPTYDSAAEVQRRICRRLVGGLADGLQPGRVLDAGCGTGFAHHLLQARFPAAQTLALDLSPAMLRRTAAGCQRIAGDLEHLPLATASIDLYWSSLALQWCDLATAFGEAARVLQPGGQLAIATLGPGTFEELRQAFASVDDYQHTLGFHRPTEITGLATAAGLSVSHLETAHEVIDYPDFRTMLRAVKAVGANQLGDGRRTGLMSRSSFSRAEQALEARRSAAGLPLTYDVMMLYARR